MRLHCPCSASCFHCPGVFGYGFGCDNTGAGAQFPVAIGLWRYIRIGFHSGIVRGHCRIPVHLDLRRRECHDARSQYSLNTTVVILDSERKETVSATLVIGKSFLLFRHSDPIPGFKLPPNNTNNRRLLNYNCRINCRHGRCRGRVRHKSCRSSDHRHAGRYYPDCLRMVEVRAKYCLYPLPVARAFSQPWDAS